MFSDQIREQAVALIGICWVSCYGLGIMALRAKQEAVIVTQSQIVSVRQFHPVRHQIHNQKEGLQVFEEMESSWLF